LRHTCASPIINLVFAMSVLEVIISGNEVKRNVQLKRDFNLYRQIQLSIDNEHFESLIPCEKFDINSLVIREKVSGRNNDCGLRSVLRVLCPSFSMETINSLEFNTLEKLIPNRFKDNDNMKHSEYILFLCKILSLNISLISSKSKSISRIINTTLTKDIFGYSVLEFNFKKRSKEEFFDQVCEFSKLAPLNVIYHSGIHYECGFWQYTNYLDTIFFNTEDLPDESYESYCLLIDSAEKEYKDYITSQDPVLLEKAKKKSKKRIKES